VPLGKYWRGSHLRALVPGQGAAQVLGQGGHGFDEAVTDGFGGVVIQQMEEHHLARGAFDHGRDP
jgi:hypothetical protein